MGDVAVIAVIVGRYGVKPSAENLSVACDAFNDLILDVRVMTVIAGCVVVGTTWEGDSHILLALVAPQAFSSLGYESVISRCKLMADSAVDIHHLTRSVIIGAVALETRLL